jgi:putative glutamine amidotransferase
MRQRRPVIGIPTQTLHAIDGIPEGLPASWVMNQRYYRAATSVGAVPWMVPLLHDDPDTLREIYDRLDGVLIAGGVDMDPATYGEERTGLCGSIDTARDAVELRLTTWAMEDQKPLFGICRGLQVVNVAMGGSLYQDISAQYQPAIKHDYFPTAGYPRDHLAHEVALAEGSRLRHAFENDRVLVNSMHHQGIRQLGRDLRVTATAPDGLIEGIESVNGHFLVAVQWHPEVFEAHDPHVYYLLRAFIKAAAWWRGK